MRKPPYRSTSSLHFILICLLIANLLVSLAHAEDFRCDTTNAAQIWVSPSQPKIGESVKIMAISTESPVTQLLTIDRQDQRTSLPMRHRGGPPWTAMAEIESLSSDQTEIVAERNGTAISCHPLTVSSNSQRDRHSTWNRATEAFYSAWIEELFGIPHDDSLALTSLEPVLRDPRRNFLHNYLSLEEDKKLPLTPDCADLPYTLRAYFAWKVGLPVAYRACNRGSATSPPRCSSPSIMSEFVYNAQSPAQFSRFSRQLVDAVHSGSARTSLRDESTDLYPLPLDRNHLWPGTVYADPYGHVLVLVEWVPQTADRPGMLLAVDAQPDNSVTRKRVWEGTVLFADTDNAGPGFKAFRPLVPAAANRWRVLTNAELTDSMEFQPFSMQQSELTSEEFHARLAGLINPLGLDPRQAYDVAFAAMVEQVTTRITSVNNGEAYVRKHPREVIAMPSGAAIFQTLGPWEDYSTPSRDMRLIIAINVLQQLPEKITRHPELFRLQDQSPEQAKIEIERFHALRTEEHQISYTRSDGSPWSLTIAEILARRSAFETGYNPNDCAEIRWGAEPGSNEYATCRRHAPATQRAKMEQYRPWFREVRRPAR